MTMGLYDRPLRVECGPCRGRGRIGDAWCRTCIGTGRIATARGMEIIRLINDELRVRERRREMERGEDAAVSGEVDPLASPARLS